MFPTVNRPFTNDNVSIDTVTVKPPGLPGILRIPEPAQGLVVFAHGSGSSRMSPRNNQVAEGLAEAGHATLLFDLLRPDEAADRANVFDIALLADRLVSGVEWVMKEQRVAGLPIGLFGASTGAAAALIAAATLGDRVSAVVSRGGRPDLAVDVFDRVSAPTLLIVGGADTEVLKLNEEALKRLGCTKGLAVIPDATHLFEEPGALKEVIREASDWFSRYLTSEDRTPRQ